MYQLSGFVSSKISKHVSKYYKSQLHVHIFLTKSTWAPQTVHNMPVMNILKGFFYMILF